MRKVFYGLLLCAAFAIPLAVAQSTPSAGEPEAGPQVKVNGYPVALTKTSYANNRTVVAPLEEIARALDAKVTWGAGGGDRESAVIERGNRTAKLRVGFAEMSVGSRIVKLETAPRRSGPDVLVPVRALSEALGAVVSWDAANRIVRIDDPEELPAVGTYEKLKALIEKTNRQDRLFLRDQAVREMAAAAAPSLAGEMPAAAPAMEGEGAAAPGNGDYSRTNIQVEGVDEADWAKTDGRFVYQISGQRVYVADVSDSRSPKLAAALEYGSDDNFSPQELYVDDSRLIVIGQKYMDFVGTMNAEESPGSGPASDSVLGKPAGIRLPEGSRGTVATKIYELDAAGQPKLVRETMLEGQYVSSRKIGEALYVVANKGFYAPSPYETAEDYEPWYGDTGHSSKLKKLTLDQVRYFPDSADATTMLIGALDIGKPEQEMQVSAYLGAGQTIYASAKHLYAAIPEYVRKGSGYREQTKVHKFRMDGGSVVYAGSGTVPGTVLNRYSMDEYLGNFRIATTKGNVWGTGQEQSVNNLYVLDESMKTVGKLEKLAPGERIYSARFVGGRAYMVTFRNVDPLFAIDLRDPAKPAVLGQLKIPGYSDYLHPYDDNHIIGFGKDTAVQSVKDAGTGEPMAFYQGLKMALFDVTDVTRPKEKFKEIIGDRGTGSELLSNPKAMLFSKAKNLLAFPVELMEIPNKSGDGSKEITEYGQFVYQGAYVYRIDPNDGFTLRGRITHLADEDLLKSGQYGYDYSKAVRRILYSGDTLYTLSASQLKASDMNTLAERGKLVYPELPAGDNYSVQPIMPMPMPIVR